MKGKTLVLCQKTAFCNYAKERLAKMPGKRVICEEFGSYEEARKRADCLPAGSPAILVWSDGQSHHMSSALNMRGSVKYVFDNHDDNLYGGAYPSYDTHNSFSQNEGVLVRVCRRIGNGGMPHFSVYDEGEGSGLLHLSMDLDFVSGFPALPWMSTGTGNVGLLTDFACSIASRFRLARLDIGGFSELGSPSLREIAAVYEKYYLPVLSPLMDYLENGTSLPKSGDVSSLPSTRHFSSPGG